MGTYDFDTFKMELASCVKEYLPEEYRSGDIEFQTVSKSGLGEMTGMLVRSEDSVIAPCVYIDQAYSDYVKYKLSVNEVAKSLGDTLSKALTGQDMAEVHGLMQTLISGGTFDWKALLTSVEMKAVPVTDNDGYLEDTPHFVQGDMAAVCYIKYGENAEGMMSSKVTDTILENMGLSKEELFDMARDNMRRSNPLHIASMDQIMECMMNGAPMFDTTSNVLDEIAAFPDIESLEVGMFTMSNEAQMNGAAAVFMPEIMDALADKYPDGFYILPSSVHEVLIVPKSVMAPTLEELTDMVRSVNATEVSPQDKLSDHVHEYDAQAKSIYIAGGFKPSMDAQAKTETQESKKDKPSGR